MKKIAISQLNELFSEICAQKQLYIPADDSTGQAKYTLWESGLALSEKLNTVRSAKDLFFPQVENLVNFKVSGKKMEIIENRDAAEPFVVFGVRACDCRSFDILDRVFLSDPVDTFYQNRRENGLIITLSCSRPAETCFWVLARQYRFSPSIQQVTSPAGSAASMPKAPQKQVSAGREQLRVMIRPLSRRFW